ncbi:hypothetical protein BYZ73_13240 [Rhodovulum viride]|uniref:DUF427 domain-containing protein n=1 Tax=Rhodovulum viride TaxID=1231134 RepID=A0ABX9DF20_9RHOB|nr:hypothetical protein BYZ73_13240 [Rhodovulum viride]
MTDWEQEGERPLFARHDTVLDGLRIGPGESALKHGRTLRVRNADFGGKYPFWHCDDVTVETSLFRPAALAAIWYSERMTMRDCAFTDAAETLWNCEDVPSRKTR